MVRNAFYRLSVALDCSFQAGLHFLNFEKRRPHAFGLQIESLAGGTSAASSSLPLGDSGIALPVEADPD